MDGNFILSIFLGTCAAVSSIGNAVSYIYKAKKKIGEPDEMRNARIGECEKRLDNHDKKFDKIDSYLQNDNARIEDLENNLKAANAVQMTCLLALLKHAKNPNDTVEIDKATSTLEEYMIKRDSR